MQLEMENEHNHHEKHFWHHVSELNERSVWWFAHGARGSHVARFKAAAAGVHLYLV